MDGCPNQYYSHEQRTPYQPWAPEHCYDQQGYGQNQQFYNFDQQQGPSMECGMREDFQQYDMNDIGKNSGGNWNQNQQSNWNNNQNSGCNWSQTTQNGQGSGQFQQQPPDQNSMNQMFQLIQQQMEQIQLLQANQNNPDKLNNPNNYQNVQNNQQVPQHNQYPLVNQSQNDHFISQPPEECKVDFPYDEEEEEVEMIRKLTEKVSMAKVEKVLTHQFQDWFTRMGALNDEIMDALDQISIIKQRVARGECQAFTTEAEWSRRDDQLMEVFKDLILLIQARRLEHESKACVQEVFEEKEEAVIEEVRVGREDEDSSCYDEMSVLKKQVIELGSPLSPIPPIEFKIDDIVVESVVQPTIYKSEQDCFDDGTNSFWDEDELQELEMVEVQLLSHTPPPDEIQTDDLKECMIDLSALFDEMEVEKQEIDMGQFISPLLPSGDFYEECMRTPDEVDGPSMVELPGEVDTFDMPVPDYYSPPLCVDEYYAVEFVYSHVDGAPGSADKKKLLGTESFRKRMLRDADKRKFPSWDEVASKAERGKFLVSSVLIILAVFISRKLLVFLSIDFG